MAFMDKVKGIAGSVKEKAKTVVDATKEAVAETRAEQEQRKANEEKIQLAKRIEEAPNTTFNQRAQLEYKKKLAAFVAEFGNPTEDQDAVLFAQAYQMQLLKNPSSAQFPDMDSFTVVHSEVIVTISGYLDATNSYGAQVRGDMKLNIVKSNNQWVCID